MEPSFVLLCGTLVLSLASAVPVISDKPNIVLFLTDDQDNLLGGSFPATSPNGATPMPKTKQVLAEQGATAENFFIHTPICCPSRSELLSGRYFHNIKMNADSSRPKGLDNDCMHVNETDVNGATFAKRLSEEAGYSVGMFGKYLNNVPDKVPPGFDAWLANGGGNYIAPMFNTANLQFAGIADGKWHGTSENYTTAVVGNVSMAWIEKTVKEKKPFFAYIAPKAAHEPFNPAPWYEDHWDDSWPATEPRDNPPWNSTRAERENHHGNIPTQPMISTEAASVITGVFKNRWRTLMSVDDVIAAVVRQCEKLGVLDNTYFFYTSDHGFQLGQFNIIMDKRHVYDWDTRIHLLARGPGIGKGISWPEPATQVDLAPTFLDIAGLRKSQNMDGHSLMPLLTKHGKERKRHADGWRDSVFIEYYFNDANTKCVGSCPSPGGNYPKADSSCTNLDKNSVCWAGECKTDCYPTESPANNFIAVRNMKGSKLGDTLYAEFKTGNQKHRNIEFRKPDFIEYYDHTTDPWQMHNLYKPSDPQQTQAQKEKLHTWFKCKGDTCP